MTPSDDLRTSSTYVVRCILSKYVISYLNYNYISVHYTTTVCKLFINYYYITIYGVRYSNIVFVTYSVHVQVELTSVITVGVQSTSICILSIRF